MLILKTANSILISSVVHLLNCLFIRFPVKVGSGTPTFIGFQTDGCRATTNEVNSLEHVQVLVDIDYPKRGFLDIYLKSPSGKYSRLQKVVLKRIRRLVQLRSRGASSTLGHKDTVDNVFALFATAHFSSSCNSPSHLVLPLISSCPHSLMHFTPLQAQ